MYPLFSVWDILLALTYSCTTCGTSYCMQTLKKVLNASFCLTLLQLIGNDIFAHKIKTTKTEKRKINKMQQQQKKKRQQQNLSKKNTKVVKTVFANQFINGSISFFLTHYTIAYYSLL